MPFIISMADQIQEGDILPADRVISEAIILTGKEMTVFPHELYALIMKRLHREHESGKKLRGDFWTVDPTDMEFPVDTNLLETILKIESRKRWPTFTPDGVLEKLPLTRRNIIDVARELTGIKSDVAYDFAVIAGCEPQKNIVAYQLNLAYPDQVSHTPDALFYAIPRYSRGFLIHPRSCKGYVVGAIPFGQTADSRRTPLTTEEIFKRIGYSEKQMDAILEVYRIPQETPANQNL